MQCIYFFAYLCTLFSALGFPCLSPGPCPGLPGSMCVPKAPRIATCQCAPGFRPAQNGTLCIPEGGDDAPGGGGSGPKSDFVGVKFSFGSSIVKKSISLGYECDEDEECRKSDANSVCIDGECNCAAFFPGRLDEVPGRRRKRPVLFGRGDRAPKSLNWFCSHPKHGEFRLCPEGTFQVPN